MPRSRPFVRLTCRTATVAASLVFLAACAATTPQPVSRNDPAALNNALWEVAANSQRTHEYAAAARHYGALLEAHPDNETAILGHARNLRYGGQPHDATLFLEDHTGRLGDRPALLLELAKAYLADDSPDKALPIVKALARSQPRNWEIHSVLGIVHDRGGEPEAALAAHRRAHELAPQEPQAVNNLALALAMDGNLDEAVTLLSPITRRSDAPINTLQNLALFHAMRGDLEKAAPLVRRALSPELAERSLEGLRRIASNATTGG